MRSNPADFEMITPRDLRHAIALANEGWRPFAGGTDLMVQFEAGQMPASRFVNLWGLRGLSGITEESGAVTLGALTTYSQVRSSQLLRDEFPLLGQAAAETGGPATQNRGTLAGNIANASPAADSCPVLLVYDAELELASTTGNRWIPYDQFHLGYKRLAKEPAEIITRIRLPRRRGRWRQLFRKVGTRRAQAISKICLAAAALVESDVISDIRIAYGSVAPVPLRCKDIEQALRGAAAGNIPDFPFAITPIDDVRSTARYRLRVARSLLDDFLSSLRG